MLKTVFCRLIWTVIFQLHFLGEDKATVRENNQRRQGKRNKEEENSPPCSSGESLRHEGILGQDSEQTCSIQKDDLIYR